MTERHFGELIRARWAQDKFVCVGLDPVYEKIRHRVTNFSDIGDAIMEFNRRIVVATCNLVCAFKPNLAFYGKHGVEGFQVLCSTIKMIQEYAPQVPVILDGKFADIADSSQGYAEMAFTCFKADAVTVNPYLGRDSLQPFLDHPEKGIFVLCRTSNQGAGEFQDLKKTEHSPVGEHGTPFYQCVAKNVACEWNKNSNCGLVVGATAPQELMAVRRIVGDDLPLLIPGIGAQGGDLETTVKAAHHHFIINSSRGIIYAPDPRQAVEDLNNQIIKHLAA